ncbi:hypothetical protein [Mycetocola tolaasinivorans]|nr:hypothetical protein [Mycetocola tolaasinivorans]
MISSWVMGAVGLVIVALLVVWLFSISGETRRGRTGDIVPAERVRLRWTRNIAVLFAGFLGVGAVLQAGLTLWAPTLTQALPVRPFWPSLPEGAVLTGPTAQVISGEISEVTVSVEGLGFGARALLAADSLLQSSMVLVVLIAVVQICAGLLSGEAFQVRTVRWLRVGAWTFLIAGLGSQIVGQIGRYLASVQAFEITGGQWSNLTYSGTLDSMPGVYHPSFSLDLQFWPIGVCLALLALAVAFRMGMRLTLVNQGLRRDVEGLV